MAVGLDTGLFVSGVSNLRRRRWRYDELMVSLAEACSAIDEAGLPFPRTRELARRSFGLEQTSLS